MIRIITFLILLLPTMILADNFPARYQVTGVTDNDVLNIRAAPVAHAEKRGEYQPYAINIEVLRVTDDGKWGMVATAESNGWVSMRYLAASPAADPTQIPRPFTCSGTEPFWTLAMTPRGAEFSQPDAPRKDLMESFEAVAEAGYFASFDLGPYTSYVLTAERSSCGDGMSDREYGFLARLAIESKSGNRILRGCCTMEANR